MSNKTNAAKRMIATWVADGVLSFDDLQELAGEAYAREQALDAETDK